MSDQEDQDRLAGRLADYEGYDDTNNAFTVGEVRRLAQGLVTMQAEVTHLTQDNERLQEEITEARVLCGGALLTADPDACLATLVNRARLRAEAAEDERDQLAQENERLKADRQRLADAAEMLWVVIASVGGSDWENETPEWQEAAARWRDNYFAALKPVAAPSA